MMSTREFMKVAQRAMDRMDAAYLNWQQEVNDVQECPACGGQHEFEAFRGIQECTCDVTGAIFNQAWQQIGVCNNRGEATYEKAHV